MSPVQNSDLISLLINIIKAIPDYYCWIHVGIGTIFVISGLKYILNQLKAFKNVKNAGWVYYHMLVRNAKIGISRPARFREIHRFCGESRMRGRDIYCTCLIIN